MIQVMQDFPPASDLPDGRLVIQACCHDAARIWTECRVADPFRVLQRWSNLKTCTCVPDTGGVVPTGRDDEPIVRAECSVEDNVGMSDQGLLRFARVEIPHTSNLVFASCYNSRSIRTENSANG